MALLSVTSTGGTNTLTTTTAIGAAGHRDYLVVNEGEHSIRLTLSGATNNNVSWRLENRSTHGTSAGNVNLGRDYVLGAGDWVQLSAYNFHTAGQNVSIAGNVTHNTAGAVGNRVIVTTFATASGGAIN